ncbi:MAG: sulfotransferase [Gemmatimonadetes bacterium]|nr:sulfotransferase [Gemmatimonadota bacterium]
MPEAAQMVDRPIFIIGVGRSGSSVFHQLLSRHPQVAWLSRLSEAHPAAAWPNQLLLRALDFPLTGWATRYFDPSEAYRWWDLRFAGFSRPCRDLRADDLTVLARNRLQSAFGEVVSRRRPRLLVKITGWPRIGFLQALYPDALFIHVLRDARPVASSFLNVDWWPGWRGPSNWVWGELAPFHQAEWDRHDRSFVALAGIQWKILMDALETARRPLNAANYLDIRYEELCADPLGTFRSALEFAGLDSSPRFERAVRSRPLRSENEKWRRDFTPAQQAVLEDVLRDYLARYHYPVSGR